MWPKLLIVVTCLYVVKASVVPNTFDDEDVANLAEVTPTGRGCGYSECNNYCRRIGYARGVCIGNYCQCRYRMSPLTPSADLKEEAAVEDVLKTGDNTPVSSDEVTKDASSDGIVARAARSCGYTECNNHCRRLGHARGVCIGTYCQCRSRIARSADLEEEAAVEDVVKTGDKTPLSSDEQTLDVSSDGIVARAARSCGYTECNNHCRRLGYARGVCIGTYCQCRSRIARSADLEEGAAVENTLDASEKTHVPSDEETFLGVIIINTKTSADAEADKDVLPKNKESKDANVRACDILTCNRMCRQLGYLQGVCIGTYCQCRNFRSLPEISENTVDDNLNIPTNNEVNPEVFEARLEDCNLRWCEQTCRRSGFPGGVCVNGRCKCDIMRLAMPAVPGPFSKFENTVDDSFIIPTNNEENPEVFKARSEDCYQWWCEQSCHRNGYPGGECENGHCKCDMQRSAMPAVPTSFSKFENTHDDNLIIPTNNEVNPEVFKASSEDCNQWWCEQSCRRNGYPGGECDNGRCNCDIHRSAIPAMAAPFSKVENEEEVESRGVRRCNPSSCQQYCRRLGYRFSRCANGRCNCWR